MKLYFRIKDNGATAFRPVEDPTRGRLDLQPLADVNHRNGAIKPRREAEIDEAEMAEIEAWIAARRAEMAAAAAETPRRAVEAINAAAQWYGGKPDPTAADAARDDLLMAMHDLRATIVRYMADRASVDDEE
ncbi:MAG: hypothetical protein AAFN79_14075 [Pseudomonadota bacterium]